MAEVQQYQIYQFAAEYVQQSASSPAPVRIRQAASNTANAIEVYNPSGVLAYAVGGTGGVTTGAVTQSVSPASGVSTTIANGNTVTPTASIMRTTNVGAVTGLIVASGTVDGQTFTLINEGSGTVSFAAVGTSHVADGATTAIPVLTGRTLVWMANVVTPAWYRTSG